MKTTQILIIILLFFVSLSIHSRIELKGKIVDFTNLLPIENASVYVKNTTTGTVSNSDGKFVLTVAELYANDTLVISSIRPIPTINLRLIRQKRRKRFRLDNSCFTCTAKRKAEVEKR